MFYHEEKSQLIAVKQGIRSGVYNSLCRHSKEKPGALATSSALQQASPKLKQIYHSYYTTHPKEFIELLHFMQSGVTLKEIESSINQLRNIHPSHVTTEKLSYYAQNKRKNRHQF